MNLDDAYDACEEITRREARNFSYGIRLLPAPKRRAMSALYAVARRIDDVGDGDDPPSLKRKALDALGDDLRAIAADPSAGGSDPVLVALSDAARRWPLPFSALHELIDGCLMDVDGTEYETIDDLVVYCRRVAGTVGRLSLAIYGSSDPPRGQPLADALGVALQLTNVLRDVVEDRDRMGRIYLPAADVRRFGCAPDLSGPVDAVAALISFEAARAAEWYAEGLQLLPLLDRRSRACTAAMAGIYRRLLDRIRRDPTAVLRGRLSLPTTEKALVAGRALVRGRA
ncbi:MAG TPA: presqualene diphosphate synthase HpnD [Acidimicrobiales bacterium]|nr:presqualene diphosphate synthase HpnD [Acidimicrobiales bacterium]